MLMDSHGDERACSSDASSGSEDAPCAVLPSFKRRITIMLEQLYWLKETLIIRGAVKRKLIMTLSGQKHTLSRCDSLIPHRSYQAYIITNRMRAGEMIGNVHASC